MSAIFGRYHFDDRPVPRSTLRSMQEAMASWPDFGDRAINVFEEWQTRA